MRGATVAFMLALAIVATAQGRDPVSDGVAGAVLLATNSIQLDRNTTIVSGDLVVNGAASGPVYGERELSLDQSVTAPASAKLIANGIDLDSGASAGSVYYNNLTNQGTIAGSLHTPLALPVFAVLPALLQRTAGNTDVNVAANATVHVIEGDYRALVVGSHGIAIFDGGGYAFTSISVAPGGVLRFAAPSTVVVLGRIALDRETAIETAAGSGLAASAIQIHVHGANGGTGGLTSTPSAVSFGRNATIAANLYAPNGSIVFAQDAIAIGAFYARDILVGRGGRFTLASAYNTAPTADPQRVSTNGAAPLSITLTGSDPEGQPLAFSIDVAPTNGTLSALTQVPPSSATVTYTPAGAGNVADSFTFRVTDSVGASGVAVVFINPANDDPPPPPPTTVIANDFSAAVVRDTATTLALTADAPSGVTLSFSIVSGSGPFHGSLGAIVPGTPATVTYTPDAAYTGTDSFQFQACGDIASVTVCDTATVSITVLGERVESPSLASNVEVSTPADTSVLLSLGGTSTGLSTFRLQPHAAFLQTADVAGNVADANGDGIGDNHNALPGSVPVFMSAGVGQAGGAGSNGTARMQIEFDISFLTSSSNLQTATVSLDTHRGTVDSLDTRFFALLGDNDGLLTDSDFADAGEAVAVMPVPSTTAMPIGSDGTFSFDVLGELRNAIDAGHHFFVVQGRVDESLSGSARGLEVFTTASGNVSTNRTPELQLTTPGVTAPRVYTLLTLPVNGTLFDGFGAEVTSVPYTLPDARVTYTPSTGFIGTNTFDFRVSLGTAFADATATVHVTFLNCATSAAGCNNGR
ncbi:MAG TPA: Ig-like domain-containing protein [Thermoanaerobaculia bacterium]|nr:Ig-like domain-containing protein [Thermoanaerobaculia bacterium]